MKAAFKNPQAPQELTALQVRLPQGTWEDARQDRNAHGDTTAEICRSGTITDQKGLCAYCEISINPAEPLRCKVEHFHPKSDTATAHDWALDWYNMVGVCIGGSNPYDDDPARYSPPLPDNLSCDSYKNAMIQTGRLPEHCEGWILNPLQIAAFPNLFRVNKSDGTLGADSAECGTVNVNGNRHASTEILVDHTIRMLNLNCDRIAQARLMLIRNIEKDKKQLRSSGLNPEQALPNLCKKYFRKVWPQFFTTIRACLAPASDAYLRSINYMG